MIYKKTTEEINEERMTNTYYAHVVKGTPKPVCEYYVMTAAGKKIDVWDLTTLEIVHFILAENGDFEIVKYIRAEQYIQDYTTLEKILALKKKHGHIIADIAGTLDKNNLIKNAGIICDYKSNVEGVEISKEEVIKAYAEAEQRKTIKHSL